MRQYLIGTILLGLLSIILSVANLFEIIHSKHRAVQAFKNIDQQYEVIGVLKNKGSTNLSSPNQIDLLESLNREIESNLVFLNANNNRLQVHSLSLLLGIISLSGLALRLYSMSKRQVSA